MAKSIEGKAQTIRYSVAFLICLLLALVLVACGSGSSSESATTEQAEGTNQESPAPETGNSDTADTADMEGEKQCVEEGIRGYFARTGRSEVPPRATPRPIQATDTDARFKGDIECSMPTEFLYTWDEAGLVTSVTARE